MQCEIVFQVTQQADGGYTAEALGEDIFTQADTWEELCVNAREAVAAYSFDRPEKPSVRLRLRTLHGMLQAVAAHKGTIREALLEGI